MNNQNTTAVDVGHQEMKTVREVTEAENINELSSNIPQELKLLGQWVNWRYEQRNGKSTKVPVNARNGNNASCDDRSTWSDFEAALQTLQAGDAAGVGFQITPPYIGIDLDKCRNSETGLIDEWARDIISEVNSYTELSPSQTGVHILAEGELPAEGRRKGQVEMYDGKRFFTMTGLHVANTPTTIEKRTAQLKVLHERIFAPNQQTLNASPTGCNTSQISSSDRPIDRVLTRLKSVHNGSGPGQWSAQCPSHGDEHNSLSVAEDADGKVLVKCHAGCDLQKIVGALGLMVSDLFSAFSLAEYAHAKKLTLESLVTWGLRDSKSGGCVEIPYFDEERASVLATRYRFSLTGPDRFRWKKNDKPCPYGLWMLAHARKVGFVVLVEGESDCHTLWQHDIPALGLPGAVAWRKEWADFLKDIPKIYAVVEPDHGGEALQKNLLQSSVIRDRLWLLSLTPAKDPSELYLNDPQGFATKWQTALSNATLPPEVNGADLLHSLETHFSRYAVLEKGLPLALSLWTIATHLFGGFDAFPYLAVTSPTKRCGKTRLGELLEGVCANPESTVEPSPAVLFRLVHEKKPTLILDEAESLSGKSDSSEALRAILNAGYRKGKKVRRNAKRNEDGGFEMEEFETFCPKVITLIGNLPDTLADRCIPIRMKRRTNEILARFRFATVAKETAPLKTKMAEWAAANTKEVMDYYLQNDLLFLSDRDAEIWLPVFAVLNVADGSRLAELQATAKHLSGAKSENEPNDLSIRLLADLRQIFAGSLNGTEHATSEALLNSLKAIDESPWKDYGFGKGLSARKLAELLRPYEIRPQNVRTGGPGKVSKAYKKDSFSDAWERYLPPTQTALETPQMVMGPAYVDAFAWNPSGADDSEAETTTESETEDNLSDEDHAELDKGDYSASMIGSDSAITPAVPPGSDRQFTILSATTLHAFIFNRLSPLSIRYRTKM